MKHQMTITTNIQTNKQSSAKSDVDIRHKLYNTIITNLTYMGVRDGNEAVYGAHWSYQNKKEAYYLTTRNIYDLVDDILDEHPQCEQYRVAVKALMNIEARLGIKRWILYAKYTDIRDRMLNLKIVEKGDKIKNELTFLGPNPTQHLDKDEGESKRLAELLINQYWRTGRDFKANKKVADVKQAMIKALLADPLNAMQTDSYVYAALKHNSMN